MKGKELLTAIDILGSRKQLGKELKVTRCQINQWLNEEIEVPLHHAIVLEDLTKGAVKVYQLTSRYLDAINCNGVKS